MKIEMPEPIHRTTCRVLYGDTDAAGVVYYANYLRFFEIGRTEYMRELVRTYRDLEEQGLILPVVECYARYKAPAVYDDQLTIETTLLELKSVSCRFNYQIWRTAPAGPAATLLVKGSTVHAAVDRQGKLTKLPAALLEQLKNSRCRPQ